MNKPPFCILTIPGRPIALKNSKRIFGGGRGRKKIVLPSSAYVKWEQLAAIDLSRQLNAKRIALIDFEVETVFRFYFANRASQADLSNLVEGPQDLLQRVGVLQNDNLIRASHQYNFFGHEPRTEIEIYKFDEVGA